MVEQIRKVVVFSDLQGINEAAAKRVLSISQNADRERGEFHFVLAGGGTPRGLYKILAKPPYSSSLPWSDTHVYWGDERSVSPEERGSNYGEAEAILLRYVPLRKGNIHRIRGEMDPEAAAEQYKTTLSELSDKDMDWPRFDLVLLGMGSDGHTASLFPGQFRGIETRSPVITAQADYEDRPSMRITMTPLAINSARHIIILVSGENKSEALAEALDGPNNPEKVPVQRIQPLNGSVTWLVDEAAASKR